MVSPGVCTDDRFGYTLEDALASVGPGWSGILRRLWERKPPQTRVAQVKEKFGGLRFYVYDSTAAFNEEIDRAENESYKTCEECGMAGTLDQSSYWVKTLCPTHTADRDERARRRWEK